MINVEPVRPIAWDDSYSIGVKSIDLQHKQLLVLMNDLASFVSEGYSSREKLNFIIAELVDFTVYHLDFEADCMFRFEYDQVLLHLEQHELFKEKLNFFRARVAEKMNLAEVPPLVENMWYFLFVWLHEHITGSDRGFVDLFHSKGMV